MYYGILAIFIGILAVPSLILAKKPNAKELFDKIAPYQGWIGIGALVIGILNLINVIRIIGYLSNASVMGILLWISALLMTVAMILLGFIMGYGLLEKYIFSKKADEQKDGEDKPNKGADVLAKLAPLQGKLGLVAIIAGLAYCILWVIL